MRRFLLSLFLLQCVIVEGLYAQSVIDPDLLVIGRDELPTNGEIVTDTFFFFDESKAALRFGRLFDREDWSPDSIGDGSTAWGRNTRALSIESTAWGVGSIASGSLATSWGFSSLASGESSTAFGFQARATGVNATSWGVGSEASGSQSTSWGAGSIASGDNSTVWGEGNQASGSGSTAWGFLGEASGDLSTAWGSDATASGSMSTAFGNRPVASGESSAAWGRFNIASGRQSTTWGNLNIASGESATSWGFGTKAIGNQSTAIGSGTIANADNSLVIGEYNDTIVFAKPGHPDITDPLFIIGNGTGLAPANAMVVRKNGTVGIGTNGGDAKLDVRGLGDSNEPHLLLVDENPTASFPRVYARLSDEASLDVSHYWEFNALAKPGNDHANAKWNFFYAGSGKNILQLQGNGNVFLDGNIAVTSDLRLKTDIRTISNRASDLLQLGGYIYHKSSSSHPEIGVIAQEVEEYFPELVIENDEGYKTVNYDGLIPILLEVIKNQEERIRKLEIRSSR